jgi:hypothetical protein
MSSGDEMEAGKITTAENITDLVGARPSNSNDDFSGEVIFRVGPHAKLTLTPRKSLDGIYGIATSGLNQLPGGTGVVGFGGYNEGTGVRGHGGESYAGGGGTGVHGIGGRGSQYSLASTSFRPPGIGVLGIGGDVPTGAPPKMPGGIGVQGVAGGPADGVVGISNAKDKSGVYGFNSYHNLFVGAAYGVFGRCDAPAGAGVGADSKSGVGVRGRSGENDGVVGLSDANDKSGVFGFNSKQDGGYAFGVFGRCDAPQGAGVSGRNDAENGDAVSGYSPKGYGGHFTGGRAPLRLDPSSTLGAPTAGSHLRGEFFVDGNGELFYCKADGNPGAWFRVGLTPA